MSVARTQRAGVEMQMSSIRSPLLLRALASDLDAHCARLGECRRCAHSADVQPIVSKARAPRAMLVGQAPGQTERAGGPPFAGRAGKTLFQWLARAGLDESTARELLYIAAVTRCYPGPHPSGRGDRVPSPTERAECGHWLDEELRIIRPDLIIPVGRLAIDRFLGPRPLDTVVGREHEIAYEGGRAAVIPLPHPSGASSWIHQPANRLLLDKALGLLSGRLAVRLSRTRSVA